MAIEQTEQGESKESRDWLSQIGAAMKKGRKQAHYYYSQDPTMPNSCGCVRPEWLDGKVLLEEPRQWQSFVYAEAMEEGLSHCLSSRYTEPPPDREGAKAQRIVVQRSQDRSSYSLLSATGETLLVAKTSNEGSRFDLSMPCEEGEPALALGPAFTLTASNSLRDNWTLKSARCDRCEARGKRQRGTREIARFCHYLETIGVGQAYCMDVDLPETSCEGSRAVFCDTCGDGTGRWVTELTSRRPTWNARHQSLSMDFGGRCSQASAKNFQLEDTARRGKVKLLYGKIGDHRFTLDYKGPLGMVQAFAAALSTSQWT